MMGEDNFKERKTFAVFEVFLMIVSLFAFSYFIGFTEDSFAIVSAKENEDGFQDFLDKFTDGELSNDARWNDYPKAGNSGGVGCCLVSEDNQVCGTATSEFCLGNSPFSEGALCGDTSFCEKGCCYNKSTGVYDKNVLELGCGDTWVNDPNCNLPEAGLGCCLLGNEGIFETRGQCETDSLTRAIGGNEVVDWNGDVDEAGCLFLSAVGEEGACVLEGGGCEFVGESDCSSYGGDFFGGYLCSSPSLDTDCEMSEKTGCVDGKDGVYFIDSCGNPANIYDSSKINDVSYWNKVVAPENLCGDSDVEGGNANSPSCGNCNRFAGGICSLASEDNFDVDVGDYYCRDMSCEFKGKNYNNGESWCVYDGVIGEGNDVVGSRHWKYVCSQGIVQVEPCADYRNQICIQSDGSEMGVNFNNAVCVANNWRECISINDGDDAEKAMNECRDALNCRVQNVEVSEYFKFDVCAPKYPGGFSFNDERYAATADTICGMATQNCTVVKQEKTWGGCEYVANKECEKGTKFAEEMNELCRGLGDCGGSVNIVGEYSESYSVKKDGVVDKTMYLTKAWISKLKALAKPVDGQFAEVEDYSEYLEAAGFGKPGATPGAKDDNTEGNMRNVATGIGGIGTAAGYAAGSTTLMSTWLGAGTTAYETGIMGGRTVLTGTTTTSYMSAFSGAAIGAGMGMIAGLYLANAMDVSPGGTILMAVGGAMIGGAVGYAVMVTSLTAIGPVGWAIIIIGAILMIIGAMFKGSDCDNVVVQFECKAWEPPKGGDDCEKCNGDSLKPCSLYRCESLGARCELINVGTGDELCVDGNHGDVSAPIISRDEGVEFDGGSYEDNSGGFDIIGDKGRCLSPYEPLVFGVVTSEPAQCRFDIEPRENFDEMSTPFGGSSYLYNHSVSFSLPNPDDVNLENNASVDTRWNGDVDLYVKCQDRSGLNSPGVFKIGMCIDDGDDITAPEILSAEIGNKGVVSFDAVDADVEIVTNEPVTCRWDVDDVDYSDMSNSLVCGNSLISPANALGYVCSGNVPFEESSQKYYVNCMDQPWLGNSSKRNVIPDNFVLNLRKPESAISIDSISPSEDFDISTNLVSIDLSIVTSGGGDFHFCSYSFSGYDNMIDILETGTGRVHSQVLNRGEGMQKIYVECHDETEDFVRDSVEFEITRDTSTPVIARVWEDSGFVNLVLTEEGSCKYSLEGCSFAWSEGVDIGEGTRLSFEAAKGSKYYIKCKDEFGNVPSGCSINLLLS